ncbi:M13 family metallopeptidase [Lysobacter sp. A6]|uniref:M13 family metallopeptidase n=1 Tax=Noviluteimonas lactosilytica TaxID=2888523 RepID=A0ABS8JIG1_9GAMM|nr:M13 family metallopeptidase [Lysobacter lactosilyticus]MCC8363381.1 M13 family metallopeptidase [Lysobacter lactosilyticus]
MQHRIGWILTTALIVGCTAQSPNAPEAGKTQPAASTTAAPAIGIDLAGIDKAVQPGDDFEEYANGAWRKATEIPADRASTGTFLKVFEVAEKRNADLIQNAGKDNPAAGTDARRIADYYAAYMDEAAIEKRGLAAIDADLKAVDAIADKTALSKALGAQMRADVDPLNSTNYDTSNLFGVFVSQPLNKAAPQVPYIMQGGLGMPNRDYYLAKDAEMAANRDKYVAHIEKLLTLSGTPDAAAKAKAIFDLETKIANAHANVIDTGDVHKANNPWTMADWSKKAPGIDWNAFFEAAKLSGQPIVFAWQPEAIAKLSALVASEPLQTWKDYLRFHTINQGAGLLPKAYADENFAFYGTTLQGTPKQSDRWKRAVGSTNNALGDAVGQIYIKQYFPASSKQQVESMVSGIVEAFDERLEKLDWMTAPTKAKAREKVKAMQVSVGYGDTWRDYSTLEVKPDDALGNSLRASKFEYDWQLAKLGKPLDRGEWWMTPQTVNAVNLPLQNALNFPAAILEPPFFDAKADAAANYGAIGAVIGHEISHSFDNMGAEFDADGTLRNWWSKEDMAHFKAASDALVKQYDAYEPLPGLHLNGQQVLGENIADVAGLTAAHMAYRKSLGGKEAPVIDGLTGDQRFFLAYAQAWRGKVRDAALRAQIIGDGHAPGRYRAMTVRNLDSWYDAFGVQAAQKLYLAPDKRVQVW